MTDLARWMAGWAGGLAFVGALGGGIYLWGRVNGADASDERWVAAMALVEAEMVKQQTAQRARAGKLAAEVETLRRRPEQVRVITEEVVRHVVADAECKSLPESLRVLWDAGRPDPGPASAAGLGDAPLPAVAAARR